MRILNVNVSMCVCMYIKKLNLVFLTIYVNCKTLKKVLCCFLHFVFIFGPTIKIVIFHRMKALKAFGYLVEICFKSL